MTSIEDRLAAVEARLDAIEASQYHPAASPSVPAVQFDGFTAGEQVTLALGGPGETMEDQIAETIADGQGRALFVIQNKIAMVPPPDTRVLKARGERSGRQVERGVGDSGLTIR